MAFPVFLLLLVLGTGEGLEQAAPPVRDSRTGTRAGGKVPGQGERSGIPFKVGTRGCRSQWHPGSSDIVASRVLAPGCSDPGLVVPRYLGAQTAAPLPCPKGSAKGWAVAVPAGADCARGLQAGMQVCLGEHPDPGLSSSAAGSCSTRWEPARELPVLAPSQARLVWRAWGHPSLSPTARGALLGGMPEPLACQGHPRMEGSAGLGMASVPSQLHLDPRCCHKCPAPAPIVRCC